MSTVIKIENLYKEYRLGVIGHGTLYRDLQSWWAKVRGREDPNSLIGHISDGTVTDHILALNDINLDVKEGEVLGIIGKNGAGKSTLLKVLSRVTAPSKGLIKVKGRIASLLEVGTGFHPELTGRENIYLNGAINGMDKREVSRKLDEIVDFAGVGQFLDTPVKRYSSGMYVRLGFSVAAHLEPEILMVDEVLAVGDVEFQKKCLGKMKDISIKGRTVLFISHNMASINTLCQTAIVLNNGEKVFQGKAKDSVDYYLDNVGVSYEINAVPDFEKQSSKVIQFTEIYMKDEKGARNTRIAYNQHFYINIEFKAKINNKEYYMVLWVGNRHHNTIFWTADCDISTSPMIGVKKGYYRYSVRMPKSFFKPGSYNVTVCLRKKKYSADDNFAGFNDVVSFDIIDYHKREANYADSAVVAPEIIWKLQVIENESKD